MDLPLQWLHQWDITSTDINSPLPMQAVRDRVLATSHLLRALYKKLEEKIFRAQKKELTMRTQGLDPEIPLPSTLRRKGVRDPQGYILQEYMQDSSQIY